MTDLQTAGLQALLSLAPTDGGRVHREFLPALLRELALLCSYACDPPPLPPGVPKASRKPAMCIALARASLEHALRLCVRYIDLPAVVAEGGAADLVSTLAIPLIRRLDGPSVDFWRQSAETLCTLVRAARAPNLSPPPGSFWDAVTRTLGSALTAPAGSPDSRTAVDAEVCIGQQFDCLSNYLPNSYF
jgi:hypothetical protein